MKPRTLPDCDVGTIGGLQAARGLLLAREKMKKYSRIQVVCAILVPPN
jgi:hypothetical protein